MGKTYEYVKCCDSIQKEQWQLKGDLNIIFFFKNVSTFSKTAKVILRYGEHSYISAKNITVTMDQERKNTKNPNPALRRALVLEGKCISLKFY